MITMIRRAMERRRLTVVTLAAAAHLSASYLYSVLAGDRRVSTRGALLLAGPLGTTARALLVAQLDDDLASVVTTQQEASQ